MTFTSSLYSALLAVLLFVSCSDSNNKPATRPQSGSWQLVFNLDEVEIPIRLSIQDSVWTIHNSTEEIVLDSIQWTGNVFHVNLPLFNTSLDGELVNEKELKGLWTDHSRDSIYQIPFQLQFENDHPLLQKMATETAVYAATFSPDVPQDMYKAVGLFNTMGDRVTGTFLTETGDYRYLEGATTGQSMHMACFDGSHLFYFCANVQGDSLTDGKFYSGKHWNEEWNATLDPEAMLHDPDSLTFLKNTDDTFNFKVRATSGDSIEFGTSSFADKVTIVQLFGSWCPNCTDESRFLKQLYSRYQAQGLQIVPVAFERGDDFKVSRKNVQLQFSELGLDYPAYFGGTANKSYASIVFSDLSEIISYPTTLFVDKKGRVRKIHTGFYGPGTGDYYRHHTEMLELFVQQLLAE